MMLKQKSLLILGLLGILFAVVVPEYAPGKGKLDFLRYWAATHLFVTGGDAYDSRALLALEQSISPDSFSEVSKEDDVVEAWNPPWLLTVLAPLGWLPFNIAVRLWVFCNTFMIGFSAWLAWELLGRADDEKGFSLLLAGTFWSSSTILLIQIGQISSLLLLALVLFIYLIRLRKDGWAGAVLFLFTFKPHITYLVLLTIGLWVLFNRRWGVVRGGVVVTTLCLATAFVASPKWPAEYFSTVSTLPFNLISTSTVGSLVEMFTGVAWFKYLGILLLPGAYFFARQVERWGWLTTLNMLVLLSLPLSFYGFSFDQVVCIPAVAELIAWLRQGRLAGGQRSLVIAGILAVYLLAILIRFIPGVVYSWTVLPALMLLVVYFFAWKICHPGTATA